MARDIKIRITGDSSGLKGAFADATKDAEGFGSKIGGIFGGIAKAGAGIALGAAGGVVAAVPFLKDAVDRASDFNEAFSKSQVIFGGAQKDIANWSLGAAKAMGLSQTEAIDAASTMATFGKAAGLTGDELTDFSKSLVERSSDLTSFFNGADGEAIEALGAALRGESEPIRKFGVLLNEDTLKATALSHGLVSAQVDTKKLGAAQEKAQKAARATAKALKEHGANSVEYSDAVRDQQQAEEDLAGVMEGKVPQLTQAQKIQAAYLSIMEQTTDAAGDYARTSDGLANKQRTMTKMFADAKMQLGAIFLPVMEELVDFLMVKAIPAFQKMTDWIGRVAETVRTSGWGAAFEQVAGEVKGKLGELGGWLRDTAAPAIWDAAQKLAHALADWVVDPAWPWLVQHLGEWLGLFGGWFTETALPWMGEKVSDLGKVIGDLAAKGWDYLKANLPGWLSDFAGWFEDTAWPWLTNEVDVLANIFANWVLDAIPKLVDNLKRWLERLQNWFESDSKPSAREGGEGTGNAFVEGLGRAGWALTQQLADWSFRLTIWFTKEFIPAAVKGMGEMVWAISKTLGAAGDRLFREMKGVGRDIVNGIIAGIKEMAGELSAALKEYVWNGIPEVVRRRLGIFSPSKVMATIGGQIAEGLAVGLAGGSDQVAKSSQLLANAAIPNLKLGAFPSVRYNPDGTVQFSGDATNYQAGQVVFGSGTGTAAKATSANVRPLGLGDDSSSGGVSLSSTGLGSGGGTYNITINGVIIGDRRQLGEYLTGVLRDYDRSVR